MKRGAYGHLDFVGGVNFRELGGLHTDSGRHLKKARVFRSGLLSRITPAATQDLNELGISRVFDFRTSKERKLERTTWRPEETVFHDFPDPPGAIEESISKKLSQTGVSAHEVEQLVLKSYPRLLKQLEAAYRKVFRIILESEGAFLFHCTAGKDRTGIFAGLFLSVLGVDEELVFDDYAASEQLTDFRAVFAESVRIARRRNEEHTFAFLNDMPASITNPILRSNPEYLRHLFHVLVEEHGSVKAYVESILLPENIYAGHVQEHFLE